MVGDNLKSEDLGQTATLTGWDVGVDVLGLYLAGTVAFDVTGGPFDFSTVLDYTWGYSNPSINPTCL